MPDGTSRFTDAEGKEIKLLCFEGQVCRGFLKGQPLLLDSTKTVDIFVKKGTSSLLKYWFIVAGS